MFCKICLYKITIVLTLVLNSIIVSKPVYCITDKIEYVESILLKADTVEDFLSNDDLRQDAFVAMKDLYNLGSDKFSKKNYDIILKQLEEIVKENPMFSDLIWKINPDNSEKHSFIAGQNNINFNFNVTAFNNYINNFIFNSQKQVKEYFPNFDQSKKPDEVLVYLDEISVKINDFLLSISSYNKINIRNAKINFFNNLSSNLKIRAAILANTLYLIQSSNVLQNTTNITPISFIELLIDIERKTNKNYPKSFNQIAPNILPKSKDIVVHFKKDKKPWSRSLVKEGEYTFVPAPRNFYKIVKGFSCDECTGGALDSLNTISPRRWASALLTGSEFYFVANNNKVSGWIQLVNFIHTKTKKAYLNFESGSFLFSQDVYTSELPSVRTTFFSYWLKAYNNVKKNPLNVMMSESFVANNAGSIPAIMDSLPYKLATVIGGAVEFEYSDPEIIHTVISSSDHIHIYDLAFLPLRNGQHMMVDINSINSGDIKVFNDFDFDLIKNYEKLKYFYESKSKVTQLYILSVLLQYEFDTNELTELIVNWWGDIKDSEKNIIYQYLRTNAQRGDLNPSELLNDLVFTSEEIIKLIFSLNKDKLYNNSHKILYKFKDLLLSDKVSFLTLKALLKNFSMQYFTNHKSSYIMINVIIDKLNKALENKNTNNRIIEVILFLYRDSNNSYGKILKNQLQSFVIANFKQLVKNESSISKILKLHKLNYSDTDAMNYLFFEVLVNKPKSIKDYVLITNVFLDIGLFLHFNLFTKETKLVFKFIKQFSNMLGSESLKFSELLNVFNSLNDLHIKIVINKILIKKANNSEEYLIAVNLIKKTDQTVDAIITDYTKFFSFNPTNRKIALFIQLFKSTIVKKNILNNFVSDKRRVEINKLIPSQVLNCNELLD